MGRFACGWHRLPKNLSPGNHRPGPGPIIPSIPRGPVPSRGPRRSHQSHLADAGRDQRLRAFRGGGARRQDVIYEEHSLFSTPEIAGLRPSGRSIGRSGEGSHQRLPALGPRAPRLRAGVGETHESRHHRQVEATAKRSRESLGLVVPAMRLPPAGQRDPRHDLASARRYSRHRVRERASDRTATGELQPVDRVLDRTVVQER